MTTEQKLKQLLKDDCDTDWAIRETLRPFMDVSGDSHGVPPLEDLVARAAKELEALRSLNTDLLSKQQDLRQENSRLREVMFKGMALCKDKDVEIHRLREALQWYSSNAGTMAMEYDFGKVAYAALNPPKRT